MNIIRFHGVFAPHSRHRALVTPAKRGKGNKAKATAAPPTPAKWHVAMHRAQSLKRVFHIDIATCPACGGAVTVIARIEDPVVIKRILDHLDQQGKLPAESAWPAPRAPPLSH